MMKPDGKYKKKDRGITAGLPRPTEGEETVFLMGRNRGKGNAEELRGEVDNQVDISDDYAAYDNLFARHQLCMAHPRLRNNAEKYFTCLLQPGIPADNNKAERGARHIVLKRKYHTAQKPKKALIP